MNKTFFSNLEQNSLLFKRFQVIRCLHAHQHGAVYFCLDKKKQHRAAALKIISTEDHMGSVTGERFQNELEVSRRIQHPNVLRCEGFYQDHVFTAFGMDYLNGGTLSDYLEKNTVSPWEEFIPLMLQLCSGVHALHFNGIIHRDLKPENILLTPNLDLKIADFGIAVIGDNVTCGEDDVMVGTLNYLSPEYIEKGIYDMRSDIYSIGIIAFELLTGKLPFSGKSPLENLMQRVQDKPLRPEYIRNDCPFDLSNIVLKALHKDPEKRFQSAAEFADALMQTESFEEYVRSGYDAPETYQPTALP